MLLKGWVVCSVMGVSGAKSGGLYQFKRRLGDVAPLSPTPLPVGARGAAFCLGSRRRNALNTLLAAVKSREVESVRQPSLSAPGSPSQQRSVKKSLGKILLRVERVCSGF